MDHVEWRERPELRSPALVCAFKGWNDAGEAATAALGFLADSFDATEVARIDPEEYYDFTAVRPTVRLSEGLSRVIDWPENTLQAARAPAPSTTCCCSRGSSRRCAGAASARRSWTWRTSSGPAW